MSIINGIQNAVGSLTGRTVGTQPTIEPAGGTSGTSAARSVNSRFGTVFDSTFGETFSLVAARGVSGEFDDPSLRMEEHAALARLQAARSNLATSSAAIGGGAAGAQAAPDAGAAEYTTGAGNAQFRDEAVNAQRGLYAVRVRQSEARLEIAHQKLAQELPDAAGLVPASSGTWDPEAFVPKTENEARVFAQRMVIDAVEGAARLEIVKTQLDAATFEDEANGLTQPSEHTATLQQAFDLQQVYVEKLVRIANAAAGGEFSTIGEAAIAGDTDRTIEDLPISEIVKAMDGMDQDTIAGVVGASEIAVDIAKEAKAGTVDETGTSPTLTKVKAIATASANWTWLNREHLRESRSQFEFEQRQRRESDNRVADNRAAERRSEHKRMAAKSATKRERQHQEIQSHAQQRGAEERARFDSWMQQLAARSRS